jgi:hypothetical protein
MRSLPSISLGLLASLLAAQLHAAPVAPQVRSEIDGLLLALQTSGCEFNRNGFRYEAPKAKSHLLRKLDYLENRNAVQTTEQFIQLAATQSSVSGKPYLVECGGGAPVESKSWLTAQLKAIRAPGRVVGSAGAIAK